VPEEVSSAVLAFVILYLSVFLLSTLAMSAMGLDLMSGRGSVAATLGNIGPGFGLVGPTCNYSGCSGHRQVAPFLLHARWKA